MLHNTRTTFLVNGHQQILKANVLLT